MNLQQRKLKAAFTEHKGNATRRGIGWELTFEEWLDLWGDKVYRRGRQRDQFRMVRLDSDGPFMVSNVKIVRNDHKAGEVGSSRFDRITLLNQSQVAERLGVSPCTIQNWVKTGKFMQPIRLHPGHRPKWRVIDIEIWLQRKIRKPAQPQAPRGVIKKWESRKTRRTRLGGPARNTIS